jgi:hypothetical protein
MKNKIQYLLASLEKNTPGQNKFFILKYSVWVIKKAELYADFESVEKVFKKCTKKKLLSKP